MKILKIQAKKHHSFNLTVIQLYVYSTYNLHTLFIGINLIIILGF